MPDKTVEILQKVEAQTNKQLQSLVDQVDEKIAAGKTEADGEVQSLREEIEKQKTAQDELRGEIKNIKTASDTHEETRPVNVGKIFQAIALQQYGGKSQQDAWKDAGYELEVINENKEHLMDDGSQGGYLVPTAALQPVVGLAFASTPLTNGDLPTFVLQNLRGEVPIPKVATRGQSGFTSENGTPTEVNITFEQIWLRRKRVAAYTVISRDLIFNSPNIAQPIIERELGLSLGLELHRGALLGTGGDSEPRGLTSWQANFTASSVDAILGANGGRFKFTDAEFMKMDLDAANEKVEPEDQFGYLMRPEVLTGMKTERIAQYAAQPADEGQPIVIGQPLPTNAEVNGLIGKFGTTTQLSRTETRGASTDASSVYYGNWRYMYLGFWQGMELRVSDQASTSAGNSVFLKDQLAIMVQNHYDVAIVRPTAFTRAQGARTTPSNW
jgi:HK97 family phage major capsid protein